MNKKISALIAAVLVFSMLFTFAGCQSNDEEEPTTTIKTLTPLPTEITSSVDEEGNTITDTTYSPAKVEENKGIIMRYFNERLENLLTDKSIKAAVNVSQDKKITKAKTADGEDIKMSDNEYVNAAISTLKNYMIHEDDLSEEESKLEYGGDIGAFMPISKGFDQSQVEAVTCVEHESDGIKIRTITVTLKNTELPAALQEAYDMNKFDEVKKEFQKTNSYATVDFKGEPEYKDCQIILVTNVETDDVLSVAFAKRADVTADITGQGSLKAMGTVPVTLRYENTVTYSLDRDDPNTTQAAE